jgi:hypothetical protein
LLRDLQGRVRRRHVLGVLAWSVPLLLAASLVFLRLCSLPVAIVFASTGIAAIVVLVLRAIRAVDPVSIVRGLDTAKGSLEDSTDLLLRDEHGLSDLQRLQRKRVLQRLAEPGVPDLRPAWPLRRIALACVIALIAVLATMYRPSQRSVVAAPMNEIPKTSDAPAATQIQSARLDIDAPAYTGLPPRSESALEAQVPEGSHLRWRLRFDTTPHEAALEFHDGTRLPLARDGDEWTGERLLPASTLYRIAITAVPPLAQDRLYRLDAIVDHAPGIRVIEPDKTLSMLADGQKSWSLVFEASDDYGIADARLAITLAQGTGEQITVKEQMVNLRPEAGDDPRQRRYRHRLDLAALGIAQGDDVIVRLSVSDNRKPQPNIARSASFILRWPQETSAESEGIDGIVQKTLPAYFRSQRQIIIDSEALIGDKPKLDEKKFLARSDAIGVDQKILRLRYGQFLGEEFESGAGPKPADDGKHASEKGGDHDHGTEKPAEPLPEDHTDDDGHDHAPAAFGSASGVVAEYGHTHDHAEAATLLDPETKKILKAALAEMWQAELHLRLGEPKQALPYENRALGYIKQVQQSTRIYLARVGLELPPVDESRRLSGDRAGVRDRSGSLAAATYGDSEVTAVQEAFDARTTPDLDAFGRWVRANEKRLPDALGLIAAVDALRRAPECADCRERLQDLLWPLLPVPATGTTLRPAPDASGRAYLDAVHEATGP